MYNIYFEAAAIGFLALVLLYLYTLYPNASVSNRRYRRMLIILLVSDILDMVTAKTIDYGAVVPPVVNVLLNTAFFMVSAGMALSYASYIESFVYKEDLSLRKRGILYRICFAMYCAYGGLLTINIFTGCCFYFDAQGRYVHGSLYPFAYGTSLCIAILGLIFMVNHRKDFDYRLRVAACLFLAMIVAGSMLQLVFFPKTLLTMYMASLAAVVFLFVIETPDYVKLEQTMKELEIARAKADEANQAKSTFLAKMSHEIRTPINAVIGMNEMILRDSSEQDVIGYAMDVRNASATLLSTINDILDLSKIESGKMELVPTEYDVSSMIHDVANMMSVKANDKNLEFIVEIDESLPSRLYGDDVRIKQILINIINNAIKYTEKGSVTFSVKGEIQEDNVCMSFDVKDTGIGIRPEDMERLFAEFERIDVQRNKNVEGTGLGMSITRQLLTLMGSKLQVESVYGEGSRFFFVLQQEIRNREAIGNLEQRIIEQQHDIYRVSFVAPDARILLVDDHVTNRKVCKALLRDTQIQVDEAMGGYECIEKVKNARYDLILLDHMMPDLDGIETLHRLHNMGLVEKNHPPVIAMTANAIVGAEEMYISEGFTDFLSKPIRSEKMEEMLVHYLPEELVSKPVERVSAPPRQKKDLPQVDGVDTQYALLNLQDEELFEELIMEFVTTAKKDASDLEGFYQRLGEPTDFEENMRQYRVKVHAMKNSAATIGALQVSALAKTLEYGARDHQMEIIESIHGIFLKQWVELVEALNEAFHKEEVEDKVPFQWNVFEDSFVVLQEAMEFCDIDTADHVVQTLSYYEIPVEMQEEFQKLKVAVADIDEDMVKECIANISKQR